MGAAAGREVGRSVTAPGRPDLTCSPNLPPPTQQHTSAPKAAKLGAGAERPPGVYSVSNVSAGPRQVMRPSEDTLLTAAAEGRNPRQHLPTDTPHRHPRAERAAPGPTPTPPPTPSRKTAPHRHPPPTPSAEGWRWPLGCGAPSLRGQVFDPSPSPWRRAGRKSLVLPSGA